MPSAHQTTRRGPSKRVSTLIAILFTLATLSMASSSHVYGESNTYTKVNTATDTSVMSFQTLTEQLLRPPYVSLQSLTPRDIMSDPASYSFTYPPSSFAGTTTSTTTLTSTHTLDPTTVTITLLATTFSSALHNGSEIAVATSFSSGFAPTVTFEQGLPGCTAICGEIDGSGKCREIAGCVGEERKPYTAVAGGGNGNGAVNGSGRLVDGAWVMAVVATLVMAMIGMIGSF